MIAKLTKSLLRICRIGILIIILANLTNAYILNSSIPNKFKDAKWKGNWKSGNLGIIGGKIIANLPDEIPNNESFEVNAMIYYNIWSLYKIGGIKEFKLIGKLGDDNSGSGENMVKENRDLKTGSTFNFKASVFGIGNQKIDYSGIANRNKSIIVGGYKSLNPGDLGNFKIEKKL